MLSILLHIKEVTLLFLILVFLFACQTIQNIKEETEDIIDYQELATKNSISHKFLAKLKGCPQIDCTCITEADLKTAQPSHACHILWFQLNGAKFFPLERIDSA